MEEEGIMLPVVEAHVDYKNPAKYDDLLDITVKVAEIKGCRIRIENTITNSEDLLICRGYTIHCTIDSKTRKPVRVPESLTELIQQESI